MDITLIIFVFNLSVMLIEDKISLINLVIKYFEMCDELSWYKRELSIYCYKFIHLEEDEEGIDMGDLLNIHLSISMLESIKDQVYKTMTSSSDIGSIYKDLLYVGANSISNNQLNGKNNYDLKVDLLKHLSYLEYV